MPQASGQVSCESQDKQLQQSSSLDSIPSPSILLSLMTPCTPGIQCSEVEQTLSMDGSEVNVVFNSHKSASNCQNWYGALIQVVPEVLKPQPFVKKEYIQIKLPEDGMQIMNVLSWWLQIHGIFIVFDLKWTFP